MTEKTITMDKKKSKSNEVEETTKMKRKEKRNRSKKLKQMMKKRLIIRNLSFKVDEEKLKELFSEFGEVLEADIPLNKEGRKRGFAFIRYKDTKSQIKAMKAMNFKKINGRPIAIDFAVPKNAYQTKIKKYSDSQKTDAESVEANSNSESEDNEEEDIKPKDEKEFDADDSNDDDNDDRVENEEDKKVKSFLREFDAEDEQESLADKSSDEDSSDDDAEDDDLSDNEEKDSPISGDISTASDKKPKMKHSNDVSEGKTVFIRNVSFSSTEEDLHALMQGYGETQYCLLCMDHFTDRPKGTAFVKFKGKESAEKLLEESSKDPGILLDGRKLFCTHAISREELSQGKCESSKVTDKRNFRLLKCGLIVPGSKEAEGVSQADMAKRAQLEMVKKQKLRNINFFVSDKRLIIHNIPKNITDKDLVIMFKKAAGKGAVIKEARVMRDFKKTDVQGNPASKGFGFVSFTEHEHSLKALMELNNNPNIFTPKARPIVEFSVENSVALQAQQRRREKNMIRNKKKMEEKHAGSKDQIEDNKNQMSASQVSKQNEKRKNKRKSSLSNKKMKKSDVNTSSDNIQPVKSPKKKNGQKKRKDRNKNKNKPRNVMNSQDKESLSVLRNKYKQRLLNEYS